MSEMVKNKQENPTTISKQTSNMVETVSFGIFDNERNKKLINYYKNISTLPRKISECTFEKSVVKSEKELEIKSKLEKYCENFEKALKHGIGLYLYGKRGTGKTFYSLCIFNELSIRYRVYRTSLMEINNKIKSSFQDKNTTEHGIINDLLNADLIILDDLGKEYLSESWGKEKLFYIFNKLYEAEKCLIISTTLDMEQMKEYLSINGSDDVFDRVTENCRSLKFDWESRRKTIKEEIKKEIFG